LTISDRGAVVQRAVSRPHLIQRVAIEGPLMNQSRQKRSFFQLLQSQQSSTLASGDWGRVGSSGVALAHSWRIHGVILVVSE
jgi:hypothetical protein